MIKLLKDKRGASTVIVVIMLTAMLGAAALVTDIGAMTLRAESLQDAVDVAVRAAGDLMPCRNTEAGRAEVENEISYYLELNGFAAGDIDVTYSFDLWSGEEYCWAVRATAQSRLNYGFGRVFGVSGADISRTARLASIPINTTLQSIPIFMDEEDFSINAPTLAHGTPLTLTINGNGVINPQKSNMGVLSLITSQDELAYSQYEGITDSRLFEFLVSGYYGLWFNNGVTQKVGLSIGESRPVANAKDIYDELQLAIQARIDACQEQCGGCTFENYENDCPRIALLPVADVTGNIGAVNSFVAVWIEGVTTTTESDQSYGNTTITFYILDDYQTDTDVTEPDMSHPITEYTVCRKIFMQ